MPAEQARERREVRVQDPSLTPEANRILTEELRQVVGSETVDVPVGRRHVEREPHAVRSGPVVDLIGNRLALGMTFLTAVVVGVIVSLATGSWWFLLLALAAHGLATLVVVAGVLQMTSQTEHLSPGAVARLEAEGVGDPDAVFTELVREYAREQSSEGRTPAHEDPARAAAEQSSAVTPSHEPSKPVGP
jgi:hypothetical protein